MFVLKKESAYYWPVKFQIPSDGGVYKKYEIECQFRRLSQSRLREFLQTVKGSPTETTDLDLAREIVVGWRGVVGGEDEKSELPFNDFNLNDLLETPGIATSIAQAYIESISGIKIKN